MITVGDPRIDHILNILRLSPDPDTSQNEIRILPYHGKFYYKDENQNSQNSKEIFSIIWVTE
jgi:hypothetical protein